MCHRSVSNICPGVSTSGQWNNIMLCSLHVLHTINLHILYNFTIVVIFIDLDIIVMGYGFLTKFPTISDTLWRSVVNYWRETDHSTGRKYRFAACHCCIEGISPSLGLQLISVVATRTDSVQLSCDYVCDLPQYIKGGAPMLSNWHDRHV